MSRLHDVRQLRHFGFLVGGIFGAIGLWPAMWHARDPRWWAVALAVMLVLPALVAPRSLAPAQRAWMRLAEVLAWVNTRILLGIVFFGVVTPIGVVMRLRGRDPMRRTYDRASQSYRVVRTPRSASHMMRQF